MSTGGGGGGPLQVPLLLLQGATRCLRTAPGSVTHCVQPASCKRVNSCNAMCAARLTCHPPAPPSPTPGPAPIWWWSMPIRLLHYVQSDPTGPARCMLLPVKPLAAGCWLLADTLAAGTRAGTWRALWSGATTWLTGWRCRRTSEAAAAAGVRVRMRLGRLWWHARVRGQRLAPVGSSSTGKRGGGQQQQPTRNAGVWSMLAPRKTAATAAAGPFFCLCVRAGGDGWVGGGACGEGCGRQHPTYDVTLRDITW